MQESVGVSSYIRFHDTYVSCVRSNGDSFNWGSSARKYLVQNDYVSAAKLLSDGIHYGVRMGGIGFIGYAFIRIVIMF